VASPPDDLVAAARVAWPGIAVPEAELVDFVVRRLGPAGLEPELRERAVELVLACACARGDSSAVAAFERSFFDEVDWAARRARASTAVAADARQDLARSLFTGAAPAIATFNGRGDLRSWFRVAATRAVLRLASRHKREVLVDHDRLLDNLCPPTDPEIGHLRDRLRGPVRDAFAKAIALLSDRHRALLQRQLDGATIDDLAAEHGVHRATCARWLAVARAAVREATARELAAGLGADTAEAESLLRLVSSRLDVSLARLLRG